MKYYQLLTFLFILILPFFPVQSLPVIKYAVIGFTIVLFPVYFPILKELVRNPREKILKKPVVLFFLLFLLSGLIATIFSINKTSSLLMLGVYFSCFFVFLSSKRIFASLKAKQMLAVVLVFVTFFLSVISIYNTLVLQYINIWRYGASFLWVYYGHNHLSALLIFSIPLVFYFLKNYWENKELRTLLLFAICYLLFALVTTFSEGALISFFSAIIATSFLFLKNIRQKIAITLIAFFLVFGILFATRLLVSSTSKLARTSGVYSGNTKIIYYYQALNNFLKRPISGYGLNTFYCTSKTIPMKAIFSGTDVAHNFFIQILSDTGIFGLITSMALVFSLLKLALKKAKIQFEEKKNYFYLALWIGLLSSFFLAMIDYDWQLPFVFLIFWQISGLFIET